MPAPFDRNDAQPALSSPEEIPPRATDPAPARAVEGDTEAVREKLNALLQIGAQADATAEAIRAASDDLLRHSDPTDPLDPALVLALEREQFAAIDRATRVGPGSGPSEARNPTDRLRYWAAWADVPPQSFFTLPQAPLPQDVVYLRRGEKTVYPVCSYAQWLRGVGGVGLPGVAADTTITEAFTRHHQPFRQESAAVLVLSALTPSEFDRIEGIVRPEFSYLPESAQKRLAQRRRELVTFWELVTSGDPR